MPDIDAKKIEELLPCPFCGGAAQAEHFESKLGRWRWSIGCNDHTSKADDGGEPAAECYGFQSMTSFATKAEAIAAWNRRASHSLASASGGEDAELCERLKVYSLAEDIMSSERRDFETAAARIRALSAENERLKTMLTGGNLEIVESEQAWKLRAESSEALVAELREKVERLRKALEPFAKAASDYERQGEFFSDNVELVLRVSVFAAPEYHNSTAVQVGDLRRARSELEAGR